MPKAVKPTNLNENRPLFQPMIGTHTSQYFDWQYDRAEQNTIQDLTDESIVISGYMITYVFRTDIDIDEVLFEPNTSTFDQAFQIAATFPNSVMGWDGNDAMMNKFGLVNNPEGEFIISQRAWDTIMKERKAKGLYTFYKPREGDLIVMHGAQRWNIPDDPDLYTQNNIVFQITFTDIGMNNWQFGKDYAWRVSASAYKYDESEDITDALDYDGNPIFDIEPDFERPPQNDAMTDVENGIREFDENNPFLGY